MNLIRTWALFATCCGVEINARVSGIIKAPKQRKLQDIIATFNGPVRIPELPNSLGEITVNIEVTESCEIEDADLTLEIEHTWVGDLIMTLTSPTGTTVGLVESPNGCGSNLIASEPITFDDASPNDPTFMGYSEDPITTDSFFSAGGFSGPPLPAGVSTLTDLNGHQAQGTWFLTIYDDTAGDTGMLHQADLKLTCALPPCQGEDFCNHCTPCTTDDESQGCVYHHSVGPQGSSCALQCIGCGGTCGLDNAKSRGGQARPEPGCGGNWESCNNAGDFVEFCE